MKRRAVVLILLSVLLAACPKTDQPRTAPSPSRSPSAQSTPSAPSSERFIYEATQRPPGQRSVKTFYRSDPASLQRHRVGFPSVLGTILPSPDGRRLARLSGRTLWTASADEPARFRRIATARGRGDAGMGEVVWDPRGTMLAYLTWRATGPADDPHRSVEFELYSARFDGTAKRLIKRFSNPRPDLIAFDETRRRVFWLETGEGGYAYNLTELDATTGKVVRVYHELPTETYTLFAMSADLQNARYATPNAVAEFSLATRRITTLYKTRSTILNSVLRPSESDVVFTVHDGPSDKDITYRLSFRTGRRTALFGRPGYYNLAVLAASPTGRYLWLETFCVGCGTEHGYDNSGKFYVFDTRTRRIVLVAENSEEQQITIRFLSWLRV